MLKVVEPIAKYEQVAQILRARLARGEFTAGEKLPSQRCLAEELKINLSTVNKAISNLITEGRVFQKYGKGTYVAEPDSLATARNQILFIHEVHQKSITGHPFYSSLLHFLGREANSNDYDFLVFDSSLEGQPTETLIHNSNASLRKAIQRKEVSGIFLLVETTERLSLELRELRIPYVSIASHEDAAPNRVLYDFAKGKMMAFEHLCRRGCRKIVFVYTDECGIRRFRDFLNELEVLSTQWAENAVVSSVSEINDEALEADGLIITDDFFALEHSIALRDFVPLENIIVLTNSGMKFPLRFTRMEFNPERLTELAWKMLSAQIKSGELELKSAFVAPELIQSGTVTIEEA